MLNATTPSIDALVAKAQTLAANLTERSVESQKAGRVSDATVADFVASELHRVGQPGEQGGWGLGVDAQVAVALELARADATQGWVLTSFNEFAHLAGALDDKAQGEIWGSDSNALVSGSLGFDGTLTKSGDGYTATGHWLAIPGIDHVNWLILAGTVQDGEESHPALFAVRKSEGTVVADWDVTGLQGAGANSIKLDGVAIPAHRVLDNTGVARRRSSLALAAVPLGATASMIETFSAMCQDTMRRGRRVADNFATGLRIAESKADVDAAILSITATAAATMEAARSGNGPSPEQRALNALKATHAVQAASRSADRIFAAAGAKAILESLPIQRYMMDVHCLAALDVFNWDNAASPYGLSRVGEPLEA